MNEEKPLTQKAMARIRSLAQGNNLSPEKIELIESVENIYELTATLKLKPHVDVKISSGFGRPKTKSLKVLTSFEELQNEIRKEQQELSAKTDWIDLAVKDLETATGHGWGHDGATLFWDKETKVLTAHQYCPTCRGSAQSPCPDCQGLGTIHCFHCDGRGQEICILCQGRGEDAHNPGKPCPLCHGTRVSPCRFCFPFTQIPGRMPCERCTSKGYLPCPDCRGTGYLSQEVRLKKSALVAFSLGRTAEIPSGLLRIVQRIGEDNLPRHAKITMTRANVEKGEDPLTLRLSASIPYAEMKTRIDGKAKLISVFGEQARLVGVPPFLDESLKPSRDALVLASFGNGPLEKATTTRLMKDALTLTLQGKIHPNELRRRYPAGLSADVAKEVMRNMLLALKQETRKTRVLISALYVIASGLLFAALFRTSLFSALSLGWPKIFVRAALVIIPVVAVAKGWFILMYATRWLLRRRFEQTDIGINQPVGKTGYIAFACVLSLYAVILYFSGFFFAE